MARHLDEIALEICDDWNNISPNAKPYLGAMLCLDKITDTYFAEDAKSIVLYFLNNASGWRGDVARRIKAELKALVR